MNDFKNFITSWIKICQRPTENTMTISSLDKHIIDEIYTNLIEEGEYYIVKIPGNNIIKIKK